MKYIKSIPLVVALLFGTANVFATGDGQKEKQSKVLVNNPYNQPAINTFKYTTAIGVRGLGTSGLSIKHFTRNHRAIEGIVGFYPDAFSVTVLLENHVNAFDQAGLNWYYGFGGHLATQTDWEYSENYRGYRRADGDFGIGVDGIVGIEYKINEIPIAISMDVKPFLEVTTTGNAYLAVDPGLGVKLTF